MANGPHQDFPKRVFRVFSDHEGAVHLLWERNNTRIKVRRPVTRESLDEAKDKLLSAISEEPEQSLKRKALEDKRAEANREIESTLFPFRKGTFFGRAGYVTYYIFQGSFALFLVLAFTSVAYKLVQASSERLPEWAHLGVLGVYAFALAYLIFMIATEQNRLSDLARIRRWFGPRGLVFLPVLILLVAGSVFASFTFFLHKHGRVILEPCSGRPVTEGSLLDFYMWHFLKLVPLLQINETLKWKEPLCYTQARIGFLILLFQGLVVLPSINTIRFYWKNRHTLNKDYVEYVYDPEWRRPESSGTRPQG